MSCYPVGPHKPPQDSMFPVCDQDTVACFEYNGRALDSTEIQAIGVSVNVLRQDLTAAECGRIRTHSGPILTRTIHGIPFHYTDTGEAGGGSSRSIHDYRTFYQNVCFEVALVTARSDLSAQGLKDDGLRPARPRTLGMLDAIMDQMLDSFAFVGPVKASAGWNMYTGSSCGEQFEVPDNVTVESVAPSSPSLFNAWGLSCVERFTDNGRQYAVAAKENLPKGEATNAWLESSGFPRLDEMHLIADGPSLKEYRDAEIAYILHGGSLFIVTATDSYDEPVLFDRDGIIQHLVTSFGVR
jgi:hypothetical protein